MKTEQNYNYLKKVNHRDVLKHMEKYGSLNQPKEVFPKCYKASKLYLQLKNKDISIDEFKILFDYSYATRKLRREIKDFRKIYLTVIYLTYQNYTIKKFIEKLPKEIKELKK